MTAPSATRRLDAAPTAAPDEPIGSPTTVSTPGGGSPGSAVTQAAIVSLTGGQPPVTLPTAIATPQAPISVAPNSALAPPTGAPPLPIVAAWHPPVTTLRDAPVDDAPVTGARADQPASALSVIPAAPGAPRPIVRPALQAFGAALHRAAAAERRPAPGGAELPPLFVFPATVAPSLTAPGIAAPIDVMQARWPEAMVARIEHIRDAQNAADTRIRLHPDALGPIDVTVRREGEAVHVHLAAADPATARLLADAQPRLVELADAKGLKLAQSGVDGGAGNPGGDRRQAPAPQAVLPPRPASARDVTESSSETRLA
ncbi:MAG: hypothetical protein JWN21_374 [Sphingomonas bacterium]|nr:hypothetical protein [Sphingomonas bacterium]